MTNGKTAHPNAIVDLMTFLNPSPVFSPEMLQSPSIGGVNGNPMAISHQPLGDFLQV
jgi:hypothetical protein